MDFLKNKLNDLYLNPNKNGFGLISALNEKRKMIQAAIIFTLLIYPLTQHTHHYFEEKNSIEKIVEQKMEFEHQEKIYHALIEKEKAEINQAHNLTNINTSIQKIAQQYQIKINSLQWSLEQGKSIEINISDQTRSLLTFIHEMNKLDYLKFNTLTLTKSAQERKVELNAILVISTNKE